MAAATPTDDAHADVFWPRSALVVARIATPGAQRLMRVALTRFGPATVCSSRSTPGPTGIHWAWAFGPEPRRRRLAQSSARR